MSTGRLLGHDSLGRKHIALKPPEVELIYQYNRTFWETRQSIYKGKLPPEEVQKLLDDQVVTDTPYNVGERKKLREIYETAVALEGGFSMLELGAANGTVFERLGTDDFRYVGFEMTPELVENFRVKRPSAIIMNGDVEDFLWRFHTTEQFTLFYAHVSLIMIKPLWVRSALSDAAKLTDQFLIYDFLDYPDHELEDDETLIFDMNRPEKWFIHDWDKYIKEVGFEIIDRNMAPLSLDSKYDNQIHGCGYIHAVRS